MIVFKTNIVVVVLLGVISSFFLPLSLGIKSPEIFWTIASYQDPGLFVEGIVFVCFVMFTKRGVWHWFGLGLCFVYTIFIAIRLVSFYHPPAYAIAIIVLTAIGRGLEYQKSYAVEK